MKGNLISILIPWMLVTASACGVEERDPQETRDSTSQALYANVYGFAKSTQLIGTAIPDPSYAGSSSGKPITIENLWTGLYRVTFEGIGGEGGNAQVVALGSDNTRCQLNSWVTTSDGHEQIFVRCHTPTGTPINSKFVVRYVRTSSSGPGAYLFANQADSPLAPPYQYPYNYVSAHNFNSTGTVNTVSIMQPGLYLVRLYGLGAEKGNVLVTAVGDDGKHCNVSNWVTNSQNDRDIVVRCWSVEGFQSPAKFSLAFDGTSTTGFGFVGAFAYANDPLSASYTPDWLYSFNSGTSSCGGGSNTAGRLSMGSYFMRHTWLPLLDSNVHVTAKTSETPDYCKVETWGVGSSGGVEVKTRCFDGSGVAKDSQYLESYYTTAVPDPC
jgi:hypothetical protein